METIGCFLIGLLGLVAYHVSKLTGAADKSTSISKLGEYIRSRSLNLILAAIGYIGLFVAAWNGELMILGFMGGENAIGGYFLLGYMAPSILNHWVKAKERQLENPPTPKSG
jgi:hypothetical protein